MTYHTAHIMVHDKLLTITDEAFIHLCIINLVKLQFNGKFKV